MTEEQNHYCPHCDSDEPFYLAARTSLHLGKKTKWSCSECDYGFVRIDGNVDTSEAA